MPFERLAAKDIPDYLRNVPDVAARFSTLDHLEVAEISDGNLNYVYVIHNQTEPSQSVVLKQAAPFMRLVGEAWPLSRQRMHAEVRALHWFGKICPEQVPVVYHASEENSLVIMEHLKGFQVLRQEIIAGRQFPQLVDHLSTFLARTAFHTSDFYLASATKKKLAASATNTDLCKVTEDLVFTHPYEDHSGNIYSARLPRAEINRLRRNTSLRAAIEEMKYTFMTRAESLIHGDLHIGSVMVTHTQTRIIDPEFCFFGPTAYDPAAILSNLLLAYFSQEYHEAARGEPTGQHRAWLLTCVHDLWTQYTNKFLALWRAQELQQRPGYVSGETRGMEGNETFRAIFIKQLLTDTLGFVAAKMVRRVLGLAKVADLTSISDLELRATIEVKALRMAEKLAVERRSFSSINDVIELAVGLSPLQIGEPPLRPLSGCRRQPAQHYPSVA